MTTTKSIITAAVPTALTAVYTNNTTGGAVLKSININGIGDSSVVTETTGGSEWSLFGSSTNPFSSIAAASGTGFGVPYPVQLGDDRVLLLSLPHHQHSGGQADWMGGNTLHAQICEYQTDKYVAGPITNVQLPTAPFNSESYSLWSYPTGKTVANRGGPLFKAIALSPTVVVCAYRISNDFRIFRLTITGNSVNTEDITNLDLTAATYFNTTTAGDFELAPVRGDTTKVIIGGWASSNWSLQAINVPTTGALSNATVLFNTGIAVSTFHFTIAPTVKTATDFITTYYVAGCTATASFDGQLFTFNSSTNAFSPVGIKVTYARATRIDGLVARCISTGTVANLVVAVCDTGNPSNINFYQQLNSTQAVSSSTVSTLTLQHGTAKSIIMAFNWGDERAVFIGQNSLLVCFNSAGIATNFIEAAVDSTVTNALQNQWFPFNSRPLYTYYSTTSPNPTNVPQYYSRKEVTSGTTIGIREDYNNYFPYGHDYDARQYAWSELAGCWMVGQGGKIYALDTTGKVLSEVKLYTQNATFSYLYTIRDLTVTADGRIVFVTEYGTGYGPSYHCWTNWPSLVNNMYACNTVVVNTAEELSNISLIAPSNLSGFLCGKMYKFFDATGAEVIYFTYMATIATPQVYVAKWVNGTWTTIGTGMNATAGAWHVGLRPQYRLFMCTQPNSTFKEGRWRMLGSYSLSSQANYSYLGTSITPYEFASFSSMNCTEKLLNSLANTGWAISGNTTDQFSIVVAYDTTLNKHRVMYASKLSNYANASGTDFLPSTNTNLKYYEVKIGKTLASIALNNTSFTAQQPVAYVYDTNKNTSSLTPKFTLTGTSGKGQINNTQLDSTSMTVYGDGISKKYSAISKTETTKLVMTINNGTNDFFITSTSGQSLAANGSFRSTDNYLIPAGYSLKMKSSLANTLSTLVTVVEEE